MSIYIKGMEMPWVEHQEIDIRRGKDGKWYAIDDEWHEIIPVPDHGRLIDADALMDALPDNFSIPSAAVKVIENTIIPTDKEES